ncbi:kinase-like protein [Xylariaceae sp. AK1471]|nr:kinase-like protein [Xylariaceae sp. AK1471]
MASERASIRSLRRQLQNSKVRSDSGQYFVPDMSIINILTLSAVKEAVLELQCKPDERIGLAERVYHEAKKVFSILTLMSEEDYIVKFRDHGCLDSRLPLSEEDAKTIAGDVGIHFTNQQWEVLSESFRVKMWENHQEFGKKRILPFIDEPERAGEGGYGEVVKINILPSQQAFYHQVSGTVQVIRKRLKSREVTKELNNEKMFLRLLNQLRHPNIIRLLGSYTYREEHFFFALSNVHSLRLNQEAHGVDFEAIGYHHDIRPANILASQSTFILADFGLGNLKPATAQSQTPFKPGCGDYLAPESEYEDQYFTRAIDVWAFGCLMAETATYMTKGPSGVEQFSNKRLTPARRSNWKDSMFYGIDGEVKNEVKEWLEALASGDTEGGPFVTLIKISLQALARDTKKRPTIEHLCNSLTSLSIRAHYLANSKRFAEYLELTSSADTRDGANANTNNVWFLQQRFRAWGHSLCLDKAQIPIDLSPLMDRMHDESTNVMANIFQKLEPRNTQERANASSTGEVAAMQYAFETELDQLVESLWAQLPSSLQRRATDYWHQAILSTNNSSDLTHVSQRLQLRYGVHNVAHAMAMMKKIRLDMLQPDSLEGIDKAHQIPQSDVHLASPGGSHCFGQYKGSPVLVEWLSQIPVNGDVHPDQRDLVISLKAKSLNHVSKPAGLKTLDCVGVIKQDGVKGGYGLVYQYPDGQESHPSTLLRLLEDQWTKPYEQPALGSKFRLAFALADFLKEYHTIGWLHERFNAHNILFFNSSVRIDDGSRAILAPYIVGLHKSRPDGSFWQTDGPELDTDLQDYQHPDYTSGRQRYRPAFDYYSLGIVLLEIGLWRPIKSWESKFRDSTAVEVQSDLIKSCRMRLGVKMGVVYRDVVLRCMDGSLEDDMNAGGDGDENEGVSGKAATILEYFTNSVVTPLEKLAMTPI